VIRPLYRAVLEWLIRWMDRRIAKFAAIAQSDAAPWTVGAAEVDRAEAEQVKRWAEKKLKEVSA
jgi:hypothetical protein